MEKNTNVNVEEMNNNEKLCCDKCGKEIKTFTRKLRDVMEEGWSLEDGKAVFVEEYDKFEGEEQVDLCCQECGKPFGLELYNKLDSIMF